MYQLRVDAHDPLFVDRHMMPLLVAQSMGNLEHPYQIG